MLTQIDLIAEHLIFRNSITSKEAFELYGATRLSAIIYDLKHKRGMKITTEDTKGKTKYGMPTHYATYRLKEDKQCTK